MERIYIFLIGAIGYGVLELLWRGYTHWTMAVAGGICFSILYWINYTFRYEGLIVKCFLGSLAITMVEFLMGTVINLVLKWNVWDYSSRSFHLFGQVCLAYSVLWFFLCIPLVPFCNYLRRVLSPST